MHFQQLLRNMNTSRPLPRSRRDWSRVERLGTWPHRIRRHRLAQANHCERALPFAIGANDIVYGLVIEHQRHLMANLEAVTRQLESPQRRSHVLVTNVVAEVV